MAGFPAKFHRLAIFVSTITPERAHKNKDERDGHKRECYSALTRIVQINSWIRGYVRFREAPPPAPLDEHARYNYDYPQNQKCRQNYVSDNSEVRIFRSLGELN